MKILALEFSSARRTVAIVADGRVAGQAAESGGRDSHPFRLIDSALQQAALDRAAIDAIAVGLGPGSYAGIRSTIALAQGWALVRPVRLLGLASVESLAAQTHAAKRYGRLHFLIDAQRGEFYAATYAIDEAGPRPLDPLRLLTLPEALALDGDQCTIVGSELPRGFPQATLLEPDAAVLGLLAEQGRATVEGPQMEPIYLRPVSFVKAPPARVIE